MKQSRLPLLQSQKHHALSSHSHHVTAISDESPTRAFDGFMECSLYQVGYQDASHFNWEYKSLFGVPPMRDVQRLREEVLTSPDR